jgi:hypothetical protein
VFEPSSCSAAQDDHDVEHETSHTNNAVDLSLSRQALVTLGVQGETVMSDRVDISQRGEPIHAHERERGGIGYVLLWILGVPLPVLILIALLRGCA